MKYVVKRQPFDKLKLIYICIVQVCIVGVSQICFIQRFGTGGGSLAAGRAGTLGGGGGGCVGGQVDRTGGEKGGGRECSWFKLGGVKGGG